MTSQELDHPLLEGLDSGDGVPMDAKFWSDLKQEAMAELDTRKKEREKK